VRVVVVRDERAVVEGEREKIPFRSLGLIDCDWMMDRGNEVGSGYANARLLWEPGPLSMRNVKSCGMISPFEGSVWPGSAFYPFVIA